MRGQRFTPLSMAAILADVGYPTDQRAPNHLRRALRRAATGHGFCKVRDTKPAIRKTAVRAARKVERASRRVNR